MLSGITRGFAGNGQSLEHTATDMVAWRKLWVAASGVELQQAPRDIDIYADVAAAKELHRIAPGKCSTSLQWIRLDLMLRC